MPGPLSWFLMFFAGPLELLLGTGIILRMLYLERKNTPPDSRSQRGRVTVREVRQPPAERPDR